MVEIIWLETQRFRKDYCDGRYQDEGLFQAKRNELYAEAFKIIDSNSLMIFFRTRVKLYNILSEMKHSLF